MTDTALYLCVWGMFACWRCTYHTNRKGYGMTRCLCPPLNRLCLATYPWRARRDRGYVRWKSDTVFFRYGASYIICPVQLCLTTYPWRTEKKYSVNVHRSTAFVCPCSPRGQKETEDTCGGNQTLYFFRYGASDIIYHVQLCLTTYP